MITAAEIEKRGAAFIVRSKHLTERPVKIPVYSKGVPTGEVREMVQKVGEWVEEPFVDEDAAKARYAVVAAAVTNV